MAESLGFSVVNIGKHFLFEIQTLRFKPNQLRVLFMKLDLGDVWEHKRTAGRNGPPAYL